MLPVIANVPTVRRALPFCLHHAVATYSIALSGCLRGSHPYLDRVPHEIEGHRDADLSPTALKADRSRVGDTDSSARATPNRKAVLGVRPLRIILNGV